MLFPSLLIEDVILIALTFFPTAEYSILVLMLHILLDNQHEYIDIDIFIQSFIYIQILAVLAYYKLLIVTRHSDDYHD